MVAFGTVLLAAVVPLALISTIGALVETVPLVAAQGLDSSPGRQALGWAALAGLTLLLLWIAAALRSAAATALGDRIDALLQRELMRAVMTPTGTAHLEEPATVDLISVGRETFRGAWGRPGRLISAVGGLVAGRLTLLGTCALLAGFHMLLGAALLLAAVWAAYEEKAASRTESAHHYGDSEGARRLEYYYALGVEPPAAKEVRVFGLPGFLTDRFLQTWRRSMTEVIGPLPPRPVAAGLTLAAVVLGGLAWIVTEAAGGHVTPGAAAMWVQALMAALAAMQQSSWMSLQTELAMATLHRFDAAVAAVTETEPGTARTPSPRTAARQSDDAVATPATTVGAPRGDIRFEGVSFGYPGRSSDVLDGLDLEIPEGRSLAVVGANGAGKTTLVKLLCRLYEPTAGRIAVADVDLADVDAAAWRRRIATVFQNSLRFALPARDNITLGGLDTPATAADVRAAAERAGIAAEIEALPLGWETPLAASYTDGVDLSGGQWQRLALARALFAIERGADLLILDEPAAHMDVRAEARLYEEFMELTRGLTTVVISHRFSTVRQAHRIAVIDAGRVVEQGTHDELMAAQGQYATMFRLQAARFDVASLSGPDQRHVDDPDTEARRKETKA
ncbi:ABC transporter ATP-binding protein [Streptomyces sp. CB01201]|uniref:ABC transporter ATP-binding protein n=1 Tax=Streptomyces sp. CB01201 TaxID=2020324 RepID=UPI00131AA7BB|nr:ATP-binding cassette domain-containing protein [Streptomyces sp. CB01201]